MKTLKRSGNERKRPPGIYVCKCMRGCKRVCVHVRVCVFKQLLACWRAMPLPVPSRQKRCILRLAERGRVQQCRPPFLLSCVVSCFVSCTDVVRQTKLRPGVQPPLLQSGQAQRTNRPQTRHRSRCQRIRRPQPALRRRRDVLDSRSATPLGVGSRRRSAIIPMSHRNVRSHVSIHAAELAFYRFFLGGSSRGH